MINLANLSPDFPIEVDESEYESLRIRKDKGWTQCESAKEWLVKLHYLRQGFKEGRIAKDEFFAKEKQLVINWWRKWC